MLFKFLHYLHPTHYFQLSTNSGSSVFPMADKLPDKIMDQLYIDDHYDCKQATFYDLSWQALQRGYIGDELTYSTFEEVSIQDNYRFIRKNFHTAWVFYVLILRLISFHNPMCELKSWWLTRNVNRSKSFGNPIAYAEWEDVSELIHSNPKVSVVIPTLNRYEYLKDVLKDFEAQDYKNFEIIIVDQSDPFYAEFYTDFKLDIKLIRQEEKALWLARNTAIKASKGEFIALSEDDVRIEPNWITSHLKCLDFFKAQVSAGVFYPKGHTIPSNRSFFALSSQFATGNAMLYKSVFKRVGLFDRQFEKQRMGDGEFGLRIFLEDINSVSNPYACCVDVKAGTGGLREMGSWDAFRPSNFMAPRPIPSVLYYYRTYFGDKAAKLALWKTIPLSIMPYKFKKNKPLLVVGIFLTIVLSPLVLIQVLKSWQLSSIKIKEGAMIETL